MSLRHKVVSAFKLVAVLSLLFGGVMTAAPSAVAAPAAAPAVSASTDAGIDATFSCAVAYNATTFVFQTCSVTSGVIQLVVICANGVTVYGPVLGVGNHVVNWGVNCTPYYWYQAGAIHLA